MKRLKVYYFDVYSLFFNLTTVDSRQHLSISELLRLISTRFHQNKSHELNQLRWTS